jgi:hypothetical protein
LLETRKQLGIHSRHASRRFEQPFAIRILADGGKNFADGPLDPRQIDGRRDDLLLSIA